MFSSNTSQVAATATAAEAVDFDGTNDYLSRSSDLTGNTNNKTFTFSAWVWSSSTSTNATTIYSAYDPSSSFTRFEIGLNGNQVRVLGYDTSSNLVLQASGNLLGISKANTFYHVLFSMDMANTSNRYIYVNDVSVLNSVAAYVNSNIGFATSTHYVGALAGTPTLGARFSNVYFDKTYRDLSITANRRLFITADLKPAAGQAALNPILYLPMTDPTTVGTNAGTGGNFTLTGTIARSGRGPNQYNAPYSDLDGTADFLSRTSVSGIADGKQFTVQWCGSLDANGNRVISIGASTTERFLITMSDASGRLQIIGRNSSGTEILNAITPSNTIVLGRNYVVTISIDLGNTSNRYVYINGSAVSMTWTTYNTTNDIDFLVTSSPRYRVGYSAADSNFFNGRLGAVWFNTSYIDLSVASNLAKFVSGTGIDAKPVDLGATGELPTGTSPLIYLPMYGNNAGKNYGTGGDFTVNSGPYTGARGPNEFWGNKADFNGTTGFLGRTSALTGLTTSKTFSASFYVSPDNFTAGIGRIFIMRKSGSLRIYINYQQTTGTMQLLAYNSTTTQILSASVTTALTAGAGNYVQLSVDLANASNRSVYINGVAASVTWSVYTNDFIELNGEASQIGGTSGGSFIDGKLAEFYFTTDYIDFSVEANRLKFRDCFGNPTDLPSAITAASVPTPAIYMRFPPTSFGTNSGTGGDFTVNGTITDGGQL